MAQERRETWASSATGPVQAASALTIVQKVVPWVEQVPVWAQEIRERIVRIETMLQQYDSQKATEAHQLAAHLRDRVDKLEANQTWLWRTVIGSLITGAIALLFWIARGGGPLG